MNWQYWIKFGIIVVGSHLITFVIRKALNFFIRKQSLKIEVDPTNFSFIKNSLSFIIYGIGLTMIFHITPQLKSFTNALFAGAGIMAAVIGFASQKAFSNIIGGIFILIFRPFRVKDTIELGSGSKGVVEEITLRHTIIRNYENRRIIIPNAIITDDTIINSNLIDEKVRKFVDFTISYDSDLDLAKKILQTEAENHSLCIDNRTAAERRDNIPKVLVRTVELGDSAVKIRAYVWSENNDDAFSINCDLNESVKRIFEEKGIEIPFPHRSVVFKNNPNKM